MYNKTFFENLKEEYKNNTIERRKIVSYSNDSLHKAKKSIFALHRGDLKSADEMLKEVEESNARMVKDFGFNRVISEGAYKAMIEEYVEAKLFYMYSSGKKIDKFSKMKISHESYLGGVCDFTGELVRLGVNLASKGKIEEVEKIKGFINDIMEELIDFDLTGYMRTKYDQARGNLRKIEQVFYEISIRKK